MLLDYLTMLVDPGGERQTSTLTIFAEEGQWKVCLSDRETGMVLFRSGETLFATLDALEKACTSGRADWRAKKGDGRMRR